MTCRNDLLKKIQQLNFAMIDTGLYLNNQPDCKEALALYDRIRMAYLCAKKEYEDQYGPLTYDGVNTKHDGWSWLHGPWPWNGEE